MNLGGLAVTFAGGGLTVGLAAVLWPIYVGGLTLGPWQAWRGAERLVRWTHWWHAAALGGGFVTLALVLRVADFGPWRLAGAALALWLAALAVVQALALWGDGRDAAVRVVLDSRELRPRRQRFPTETATVRRAA